jgi:hypothetical protein
MKEKKKQKNYLMQRHIKSSATQNSGRREGFAVDVLHRLRALVIKIGSPQ